MLGLLFMFMERLGFQEEEFHTGSILSYHVSDDHEMFFRIVSPDADEASMTMVLEDANLNISFTSIKTNQFHRVNASRMTFSDLITPKSVKIETLKIHENTCNEYAMSVSVSKYVNWTHTMNKESKTLCYLFYQPKSDYKLAFDCNSDNRNTLCSIHTQESMMMGMAASTCGANATCDVSFADGFVAAVATEEGTYVNTVAKLFMIKGREDEVDRCLLNQVGIYNVYGYSQGPVFSSDPLFWCDEPKESVLVAVILVSCLILGLCSACLTYYACRPKREAYESDEAVRREKENRRKRRRLSDYEYGNLQVHQAISHGSDVGYNERKPDMLLPLCN